jgi:hypothetical protein
VSGGDARTLRCILHEPGVKVPTGRSDGKL